MDAKNVGRRLESLVTAVLHSVPRGPVMKWFRTGKIKLNGKKTRPRALVALGDRVTLPFDPALHDDAPGLPPPTKARRLPAPVVVYEDADVLVLNKPAHLAAHPGIGHDDDSLIARVLNYLQANEAPVGHRPGLAQRLDAGVTGLIPCGKHAVALRGLTGAALDKTYLALVDGPMAEATQTITAKLLVTDAPRGDTPKVVVDEEAGQAAITHVKVLTRYRDATLIELTLGTGRTHQIRAHLRHVGHPLLGDPRYGDKARNAYMKDSFGVDRPLLHAARLRMIQPLTQEVLHLEAPMPADMVRLMAALGPAQVTPGAQARGRGRASAY